MKDFVGEIDQVPPMVSALKHKGQRLYQLARKGETIERVARRIRIDVLKILDFTAPEIKFSMECSKGTYVRQLAEDIGEKLGCGACLSQIRRTKVGPFTIDQAVTLKDINEGHIRNWAN